MPHSLRTQRRFKISDDVLTVILGKMDPVSLYRTCRAFRRVLMLVMDLKHLQYKYELAVVGMIDGPASHTARPPVTRLPLLMSYKKDWPRLFWSDERKLRIPGNATRVDVSGGVLYHIGGQSFDLVDLPSCRTLRAPHETQHRRFGTTPPPECVAVDSAQSLIVAGHTYNGPGGVIMLQLRIRNLSTFGKHRNAHSNRYDCTTQVIQPIAEVSISICGALLVASLDFVGGLRKHLLMNWCTYDTMWLEDQDVLIQSPYHLLGVRKAHGKHSVFLYNISDMQNVTLEREYDLPPIWAKATMRFGRNTAPTTDASVAPDALFTADPCARILVLTARLAGNAPVTHWMFIHEAFFRPTPYPERRSVPWSYWSGFCLIRGLSLDVVGHPQVIGSRVLYLEKDGRSRGQDQRSRLNVIDFAPYAEEHTPPTKHWTHIGPHSVLIPNESYREVPFAATNGLALDGVRGTEDNIVLILETHGDIKPINILTFGSSNPLRAT